MAERGARRLLLALAALNVLGYVDRQLVAALAPVLMAELGLTRADIGFLIGPAFVVVFALGTLVLGAAADRGRRPRIVAGGLAVWSAATALTGTASGFATLVLWRSLVGVGEATLPPTAIAMLGDRFAPSRLGFATSVYYAGMPVGFACSLALAGWLVPRFGWRSCFYLLGVLGLAAVAPVWRMADPTRRSFAARGAGEAPAAEGTIASRLRRAFAAEPALVLLIAGATLLTTRAPPRSTRHLARRGAGLRLLARGVPRGGGRPRGGARRRPRDRRHDRRGAAPPWPGGRLAAFAPPRGAVPRRDRRLLPAAARPRPSSWPAWLVAQAWTLGWFGPMVAAIHERAPAGSRATVIGFGLMTINLVGVGAGSWVTGAIGDRAGLTTGLLASVGVGAARPRPRRPGRPAGVTIQDLTPSC